MKAKIFTSDFISKKMKRKIRWFMMYILHLSWPLDELLNTNTSISWRTQSIENGIEHRAYFFAAFAFLEDDNKIYTDLKILSLYIGLLYANFQPELQELHLSRDYYFCWTQPRNPGESHEQRHHKQSQGGHLNDVIFKRWLVWPRMIGLLTPWQLRRDEKLHLCW